MTTPGIVANLSTERRNAISERLQSAKQRLSFQSVTQDFPCPACACYDWCRIADDGGKLLVFCKRTGSEDQRRTSDDGGEYFFHTFPLDGRPIAGQRPSRPKGTPELVHAVYAAYLKRSTLLEDHRLALHRRGLTDAFINREGYTSRGEWYEHNVAERALVPEFGLDVLKVPGFVVRNRITLLADAGILIPVWTVDHRIEALKVRRDNAPKQRRYSLVSGRGSPSSGSPVYVPRDTPSASPEVRVSEGEFKAAVAFCRTHLPTIGIPGVDSWRRAVDVLHALKARSVRVAMDQDEAGRNAQNRLLTALHSAGFRVYAETWPEQFKAIDDALVVGAHISVKRWIG